MVKNKVKAFLQESSTGPLFLLGDALQVLQDFPGECIDLVFTSPPYYRQRAYAAGGLGLEESAGEYLDKLTAVCAQIFRVLKPAGAFWLNLGDSYQHKGLMLLPWRLAQRLCDKLGFTLRNQVIWHKVKGAPDPARDRLRNLWEPLFFFTKSARDYYFDDEAARLPPGRDQSVRHGAVVSASGVTGVRYRRKIELSTALSNTEKKAALAALDQALAEVEQGIIPDFRLVLRAGGRITHGSALQLSGRARELEQRGFYILKYSPKGARLSDVWDILPEDSQGRVGAHGAVFPPDLPRRPIVLTCPPGGVVLDPFAGSGTTCLAARELERRSIGIDLCAQYLEQARQRCER